MVGEVGRNERYGKNEEGREEIMIALHKRCHLRKEKQHPLFDLISKSVTLGLCFLSGPWFHTTDFGTELAVEFIRSSFYELRNLNRESGRCLVFPSHTAAVSSPML